MTSINVSTDQHAARHAPGGADPINMGLIQDGAVAGFANTPGSATDSALKARYAVVATVTSAGALGNGKHTPVDATSGALTMTLPASPAAGSVLSVEKVDATTNAVTVSGSLRGATTTITLVLQHETLELLADGSGSWWPVAGHKTKASLDATYAGRPTTGKHPLTGWFHVSGYSGADPTGATSSQTAVATCFADAAALTGATMNSIQAKGPTIYVDGQYLLTAALVPPTQATILGNGRELSRLFNNTTDLFAWGTGTGISKLTCKDIALETGSSGGHIINVDGDSTAFLIQSLFQNCTLRTRNTTSSIVKWRTGAQWLGNTFTQCDLDTSGSRTVPAFDMLVSSGNVINSNVWEKSWCRGHSSTAAPFFYIECNNGGYCYHNSFRDLVGEQNGGGFIHLYANAGFVVENCPDWDMAGAYANHVYKFAQGTGQTSYSYGKIENSFRLANAGGIGSNFDIYAVGDNNNSTKHEIVRIINCDPPGAILTMSTGLNGSAKVEGLTRPYRVVTTSQTLDDTCPDIIVCNSASAFSVTLPNPTGAKNGRFITIINVGAGTVTIPSTVNGVANSTLAQWASKTYMTDGINAALGRIWFTV